MPTESHFVCIHCHFYQPPRENPWLETIELQDSAYPYHDWNERITVECYEPNASARILDDAGKITRIINNYSRISFNFGATLLSWMEAKRPAVYEAILEADRASMKRFSGHGSALAQAYNHMILPLAGGRDRYTQVLWGIRDFQHRFRRDPEGMWLPETAVDVESLEILAEMGMKFTILAPRQAARMRPAGGKEWVETPEEKIDPTRPYTVHLPSGRSIVALFYDGPISRAVAFEGLLADGKHFAQRLLDGFDDKRTWPQLMHIATDGETYGHHHRFGEMALAYALHHIEDERLATLTNYGEFLAKHPPQNEAEIVEDTSWSCIHGVERWRSNCGCNSGMQGGWNQEWRRPLRHALDQLRNDLEPRYLAQASTHLKDPWKARDSYIDVVLDRSLDSRTAFLQHHARGTLSAEDEVKVWKLLELQRHAMLMYTSCGWFFDDLSGIETVQVIQYAERAIQLGQELFRDHLEERFLKLLGEARSNVPQYGDGVQVYQRFVKPATIDLVKVAAHYAISSLFEGYPEETQVYCYQVEQLDYKVEESGRARLAIGQARVRSAVTQEAEAISFGVLHLGDHNLNAGVRRFRSDEAYHKLAQSAGEAFYRADLPEVIRLLDKEFEGITYSLKSLFRDEQRKVIRVILDNILEETETAYRQTYERHAPVMRFLGDMGMPLPRVFGITAEFVLNSNLRHELEEDELQLERIRDLVETANREKVPLDSAGLGFVLTGTIDRQMARLSASPTDLEQLQRLHDLVELATSLPFPLNLFHAQNLYYRMLQSVYPEMRGRSDEGARAWVEAFEALGEQFSVRTEVARAAGGRGAPPAVA